MRFRQYDLKIWLPDGDPAASERAHADLLAAIRQALPPGSIVKRLHRSGRFYADPAAPVRASERKAPSADLAAFIRSVGTATPSELRQEFEISDGTLRQRRDTLELRHRIRYVDAGRHSRYEALPDDDA